MCSVPAPKRILFSPLPFYPAGRTVVKTPMTPPRSRDTRSETQLIPGTDPRLVVHSEFAVRASQGYIYFYFYRYTARHAATPQRKV